MALNVDHQRVLRGNLVVSFWPDTPMEIIEASAESLGPGDRASHFVRLQLGGEILLWPSYVGPDQLASVDALLDALTQMRARIVELDRAALEPDLEAVAS